MFKNKALLMGIALLAVTAYITSFTMEVNPEIQDEAGFDKRLSKSDWSNFKRHIDAMVARSGSVTAQEIIDHLTEMPTTYKPSDKPAKSKPANNTSSQKILYADIVSGKYKSQSLSELSKSSPQLHREAMKTLKTIADFDNGYVPKSEILNVIKILKDNEKYSPEVYRNIEN